MEETLVVLIVSLASLGATNLFIDFVNIDWTLTLDGMIQALIAILAFVLVYVYEYRRPTCSVKFKIKREQQGEVQIRDVLMEIQTKSIRSIERKDIQIKLFACKEMFSELDQGQRVYGFEADPGREYFSLTVQQDDFGRIKYSQKVLCYLFKGLSGANKHWNERSLIAKIYIWGELLCELDLTPALLVTNTDSESNFI